MGEGWLKLSWGPHPGAVEEAALNGTALVVSSIELPLLPVVWTVLPLMALAKS